MTEKTTAAGWVVQLTTPGSPIVQPEGSKWRPTVISSPTFQFFNVAIGSADKAVAAVRKKLGASEEAPMRVVRPLSAAEVDSIALRAGDTKPA
jgi:hypothetical protein